ncbi:MAG: lysozyme [Halioglobus sp.]
MAAWTISPINASLVGAATLVDVEDWCNNPYRDSAGLLTIGVGHLLTRSELTSGKIMIRNRGVKWSSGVSDVNIMRLLVQDIAAQESLINSTVRVQLAQYQFDALLLFAFNVGRTAFTNSTLLRLLNFNQHSSIPEQLRRWIHAGGKVVEGLRNRREVEVAMWSGDYPA